MKDHIMKYGLFQFHKLKRHKEMIYINNEISLSGILDHITNGTYEGVTKDKIPGFVCNRFDSVNGVTKNGVHLLKEITGFWCFDIDHVHNAELIRDSVIDCPNVLASWLSISGKGVKILGYWEPPIYNLERIRNFKAEKLKYILSDRTLIEKYRIEETYYGILCNKVRSFIPVPVKFDLSQGRLHQPVWLSVDRNAKTKLL